MLRHLHQVGIGQRGNQLRHQRVVALAFTKVDQLVVQITRRLARQPRVIAIRCSAPLWAVAGRASQRALRHVVFEAGGGAGCRGRKECEEASGQPAGEKGVYQGLASMLFSLNFASSSHSARFCT